jgi:mercuric reductase
MSACCQNLPASLCGAPDPHPNGRDGARHLVIVGGGSAAFAATTRAVERGWRVTLFNAGLPIGGTCVNVGCVPSKTLIRAAEAHHRAAYHPFAGIDSRSRVEDWGAVIRQANDLVAALRREKYLDVVADLPGVAIVEKPAKLADARTVVVERTAYSADRILLATGARTSVPPIPGVNGVDYLVPDSLFQLMEKPESMLVLGGRYIALECAQMLARLGVKTTLLQRSARILPDESAGLTEPLTGYLREEGLEVRTGARILAVRKAATGVEVEAELAGTRQVFFAERLLLATGRHPNTEALGLEAAGVETSAEGFIKVRPTLETSVPGVYAAGDVIGHPMFVYTAAYEGALAAENACRPDGEAARERDYAPLPWVVFTDPQVAGVGTDEAQARAAGFDAEAVVLPMDKVPRCLAARETRGHIQLVRDRATGRILGARALAHEGGELMMEIALAIRHGMTDRDLAGMFHPYLTLGEAVKLAALSFGTDVNKLSCCAT